MGASFRPDSLVTLARWTRYLGYTLLFLFLLSGVRLIMEVWSRHHPATVLLVWYGAFFIIPGIAILIIPRWVEDGYVWAFVAVSAISILSTIAILLNSIGTCFFAWGLILVPLRVVAGVLNAWPDMRDVARDRRRRNRPHGFEPVIQVSTIEAATPLPVQPSVENGGRPLPVGAQVRRLTPETAPPQARMLPRFVPESLIKASRGIRGVGGVMLIPFLISLVLGLSFSSQNPLGIDWLPVLGLPVAGFLIPGVVCLWMGPWIEIGRQWSVIVVAFTSCGATVAIWGVFAASSQSMDPTVAGDAMVLCLIGSGFCGLVLVFCAYVWRDIRDVSRSMVRDRLAAKRLR